MAEVAVLAQEPEGSWAGAWALVLVVATVMTGAGVLIVVVARRTADGRTGRNPVAGIRTGATMSSDEAWAAAHVAGRRLTELGGWGAIAAGVGSLPVAAVLAIRGETAETVSNAALAVAAGVGSVLLLAGVTAGAIKGHRAAVAVRDGA